MRQKILLDHSVRLGYSRRTMAQHPPKTAEQLDQELQVIRAKAHQDLRSLNVGRREVNEQLERLFAPRPLKPDLRPWPLCFAIFGLGMIGAFVWAVVSLLLK